MKVILEGQVKSNFTQEDADTRYIKLTEKGSANGVATLGSDSKIPSNQIPSMDYVPTSRTVNNKPLNANITLSANDVGAVSTTDILTISQGGTGVSSMQGTDYSVNRPRGFVLQSSEPSSVPNGCLVGVYE